MRIRTIRGRLALILAVPTCLLLALAGLGVTAQASAYGAADEARAEVEMLLGVQNLVHHLQRERGLTNGLLGGERRFRDPVRAQRERADTARDELELLIEENEADTAPAVESALDRLAELPALRHEVDRGRADRAGTLDFYTRSITALAHAESTGPGAGRDQRLRQGLEALQTLADAKEAVALERGSLNGVFAAGSFGDSEYVAFTEVRAAKVAALDRFKDLARPNERSALRAALDTPDARRAAAMEDRAVGGADGSRLNVDARAWWDSMTVLVDDLHEVQKQVGGAARARARELSDSALRMLGLFVALAGFIVLVVAALAVLASRSITRPLGALAQEANEVARGRLPDAVARIQAEEGEAEAADPADPADPARRDRPDPLSAGLAASAEEIAEVAAALDNVQRTALGLASEQAVLLRNTTESLANLGRRNQNLVRRQLGLITALESQELDPDALANLFELDHLATRMRRNAESVLVLVGERSPRRWSGAVGSGDLLKSALCEVEQYRRVVLPAGEECPLRGDIVAELSHLLAELLENALTFSPPDQSVELHTWFMEEDYCIAVVDHGVGMSAEDLARANARIRGEERFRVAPTRFLGHYVVGRLAAHLDVDVRLYDTPGGGVSALVALPPKLRAPAGVRVMGTVAIPAQRSPEQVSAMLTGFRSGVARAEGAGRKDAS